MREDVRDWEKTQDLGNLDLLLYRLVDYTGSPLSINSLREDLQVAHKTVSRWLDILERLYALFRISPLAGPKIRAIKEVPRNAIFLVNYM
jgi:predicted AAA+ superfamily ATPase